MIDELIFLGCCIFLLIYGLLIRASKTKKEMNSGKDQIEIKKLKQYVSSKVLIVGESGLFILLLSLFFYRLQFYFILIWVLYSFGFIIYGSSVVEKILKKL